MMRKRPVASVGPRRITQIRSPSFLACISADAVIDLLMETDHLPLRRIACLASVCRPRCASCGAHVRIRHHYSGAVLASLVSRAAGVPGQLPGRQSNQRPRVRQVRARHRSQGSSIASSGDARAGREPDHGRLQRGAGLQRPRATAANAPVRRLGALWRGHRRASASSPPRTAGRPSATNHLHSDHQVCMKQQG